MDYRQVGGSGRATSEKGGLYVKGWAEFRIQKKNIFILKINKKDCASCIGCTLYLHPLVDDAVEWTRLW